MKRPYYELRFRDFNLPRETDLEPISNRSLLKIIEKSKQLGVWSNLWYVSDKKDELLAVISSEGKAEFTPYPVRVGWYLVLEHNHCIKYSVPSLEVAQYLRGRKPTKKLVIVRVGDPID